MNDFQSEWAILHGDIEKYERFSLIIKLFSVLIFALSVAFSINTLIAVSTMLILWLQDGIWKTFQNRLEARILIIEKGIENHANENNLAFQLYSEWQQKRSGILNLIKEYLFSSLKPTVAYPYIVLVILLFVSS